MPGGEVYIALLPLVSRYGLKQFETQSLQTVYRNSRTVCRLRNG
jgi:hypothetical protein